MNRTHPGVQRARAPPLPHHRHGPDSVLPRVLCRQVLHRSRSLEELDHGVTKCRHLCHFRTRRGHLVFRGLVLVRAHDAHDGGLRSEPGHTPGQGRYYIWDIGLETGRDVKLPFVAKENDFIRGFMLQTDTI